MTRVNRNKPPRKRGGVQRLIACAVSGALLAAGSVLLPAAAHAVETCHGQSATVVPDAEGNLIGTSGPDVIVAHGGQRVDAGDGDDLVCLVADDVGIEADAGPGDDTVDGTRSSVFSVVSLGAGKDSFRAGPGEDFVWGAAPEGLGDDGLNPLDTERDDIKTGNGNDRIFSGSLDAPNLDSIATGQGDDRVQLVRLDHATSLDFGGGRNTAIVTLVAPETTGWLFDAAKRKMNFDEATSRWRGRVSRWYFHMADGQAPSSLLFLGTEAPESVFVSGPGLVPHFRLAGGDDWGGSLTTKGGTFFLGDGRDRLTLGQFDSVAVTFPFAELDVNLDRHRAAFGGGIGSPVFGVEILRASATQLEVLGSSRADRITASGCRVLVRGGSGADALTRGQAVVSICDAVSTRFEGGTGDDLLFGSSQTDDVLLGGPGFDRARGMRGDDLCRAEVTRGCERT